MTPTSTWGYDYYILHATTNRPIVPNILHRYIMAIVGLSQKWTGNDLQIPDFQKCPYEQKVLFAFSG